MTMLRFTVLTFLGNGWYRKRTGAGPSKLLLINLARLLSVFPSGAKPKDELNFTVGYSGLSLLRCLRVNSTFPRGLGSLID